MNPDELKQFKQELVAEPGAPPVSRGTEQLIAMIRQTKPKPKTRAAKQPPAGPRRARKGTL